MNWLERVCTKKYTEDNIINKLNFLIDNIFDMFGGQVFHQIVGIPQGTNCAPLLADLFLYEAEFLHALLKQKDKKLAQSFKFTFRYIDDVLSLSNSKFGDYLHLIYPPELKIRDTTESSNSTLYLDFFSKLTTKETCLQTCMIREMILIIR